MTIRRYLYVIFLISLCINSVALAQETPIEITEDTPRSLAADIVIEARLDYQDADSHVETLERNRGDLQGKVDDVKIQIAANNEDNFENIISYIGCISMDPAGIISTAVISSINKIRDNWDTYSLDKKLEVAEGWVSTMDSIIIQYGAKEMELWEEWQRLKNDYDRIFGPINPNAPTPLPTPNFCVRGENCTGSPISDITAGEGHRTDCYEKVKRQFWWGEATCDGHIFPCDDSFECPNNQEHLMDSPCPHSRIKVGEKDSHKMMMPGPCNPAHDYYACDESHALIETCREYQLFNVWDIDTYRLVRVYCTESSSYYKCTPHTHLYSAPDGYYPQ